MMNDKDHIDKLLEATDRIQRISADERMCETAISRVLDAIEKEKLAAGSRRPVAWTDKWRTVALSKRGRLAAAAVVIISALFGINYLGGSFYGTTPAFADVLGQIHRARTVTYRQIFFPGEDREFAVMYMVMEPGYMRTTMGSPQRITSISIREYSSGKNLQLRPDSGRAVLILNPGRKKPEKPFNYLEWIAKLHEEGGEFTGEEELGGKKTYIFVTKHPFDRTTVWVDPETNLPVRVEDVRFPNPDADIIAPKLSLACSDFGGDSDDEVVLSAHSSRGSAAGIQEPMTVVMTDFVWDAVLDRSLFSLEPPEGYTLEEKQFDASESGETHLLNALAFWAEMSGGTFPSAINDMGDNDKIKSLLLAKYDGEGDPETEFDQAVRQMNIVLKALYFAQAAKVDGSWGYAGATVRYGDADRPLCWWKPEDADEYRVVYGDLSIGNIAKTDLPR